MSECRMPESRLSAIDSTYGIILIKQFYGQELMMSTISVKNLITILMDRLKLKKVYILYTVKMKMKSGV